MASGYCHRMRTISLCLLSLVASSISSTAAPTEELIAAAKKEGRVVWYSGLVVNQIIRPISAAFEEKYPGIKVEYATQSAATLTQKLLSEAQAGKVQVDVFDSTADTFTAIPDELLDSYTPSGAANFPDVLKDSKGRWNAFCIYVYATVFNTEQITPADAPKTYEDLLDPKWQGKIAMKITPQSTGMPGLIGAVLLSMGHDKGLEYLKRLSEQKFVKVPLNARATLDQVIAGEYPLALMIQNYHVAISKAQGAPVEWINKMEPLVELVNYTSIPKNSQNPNAARLFVEFLLTDGQKILRDANYIPANPAVLPIDPALSPQTGGFQTVILTPELIQANIDEWVKIYNDLFDVK